MKIGVFDSGIGGLSVANAVGKSFPEDEIVYVNDAANVPYGTKSPEHIYQLAKPKIQELVDAQCDVIVLACNTVTMLCKDQFEKEFRTPFVGLEPMLKPAMVATKSQKVIVCATPATLGSERYRMLKNAHASHATVIEPDCSDWASLIESNAITEARIREAIEPGLANGADVIVLACTHYHWIEQLIKVVAGERATVMQPEAAVIRHLTAMRVPEPRP